MKKVVKIRIHPEHIRDAEGLSLPNLIQALGSGSSEALSILQKLDRNHLNTLYAMGMRRDAIVDYYKRCHSQMKTFTTELEGIR